MLFTATQSVPAYSITMPGRISLPLILAMIGPAIMAKINGNEIRPGMVIEYAGTLWVAVKSMAVKPGKGPAYNQVELKNLIDGRKLNNRFGSDERVERTRLEQKDFQFL